MMIMMMTMMMMTMMMTMMTAATSNPVRYVRVCLPGQASGTFYLYGLCLGECGCVIVRESLKE